MNLCLFVGLQVSRTVFGLRVEWIFGLQLSRMVFYLQVSRMDFWFTSEYNGFWVYKCVFWFTSE